MVTCSPSSGFHQMARMMDRMMMESLQPFGFARMTARRGDSEENTAGMRSDPGKPRDGLRTEKVDNRRERVRSQPNTSGTHAANGTRHPPTQGNEFSK